MLLTQLDDDFCTLPPLGLAPKGNHSIQNVYGFVLKTNALNCIANQLQRKAAILL
ncbi:hypothetical protein THOD04_50314 [Vibrio owensii]|nr:hypothetical protein THOD04_50314 [Vibrio owensii]